MDEPTFKKAQVHLLTNGHITMDQFKDKMDRYRSANTAPAEPAVEEADPVDPYAGKTAAGMNRLDTSDPKMWGKLGENVVMGAEKWGSSLADLGRGTMDFIKDPVGGLNEAAAVGIGGIEAGIQTAQDFIGAPRTGSGMREEHFDPYAEASPLGDLARGDLASFNRKLDDDPLGTLAEVLPVGGLAKKSMKPSTYKNLGQNNVKSPLAVKETKVRIDTARSDFADTIGKFGRNLTEADKAKLADPISGYGNKPIGDFFKDKKIAGNENMQIVKLAEVAKNSKIQLDNILEPITHRTKSPGATNILMDIRKGLIKEKNKLHLGELPPEMKTKLAGVEQLLERTKVGNEYKAVGKYTPAENMQVKRMYDKIINESKFGDPNFSEKVGSAGWRKQLKLDIENQGKQHGLGDSVKNLSKDIQVASSLNAIMKKRPKRSLFRHVSLAEGGIATAVGMGSGIIPALVAIGGKRILTSPRVMSNVENLIRKKMSPDSVNYFLDALETGNLPASKLKILSNTLASMKGDILKVAAMEIASEKKETKKKKVDAFKKNLSRIKSAR